MGWLEKITILRPINRISWCLHPQATFYMKNYDDSIARLWMQWKRPSPCLFCHSFKERMKSFVVLGSTTSSATGFGLPTSLWLTSPFLGSSSARRHTGPCECDLAEKDRLKFSKLPVPLLKGVPTGDSNAGLSIPSHTLTEDLLPISFGNLLPGTVKEGKLLCSISVLVSFPSCRGSLLLCLCKVSCNARQRSNPSYRIHYYARLYT